MANGVIGVVGLYDFLTVLVVCAAAVFIYWIYIRSRYPMSPKERQRRDKEEVEEALLAGSIMTAIGLALIVGLYIWQGIGGWLVGGLVVMFIGIALLATYFFQRS